MTAVTNFNPQEPTTRRGARLLTPLLVALAAAAWYAWPLLHPDYQGQDGDSLFLFLPGMRLAHAELLAGRMPLWNPYKFLGAPFLADLMIPIFYPPMAVAALLGGSWGLQLVVVAHYGLAAGGGYALARRGAGAGKAGAALAGLTFAMSGTMSVLVGRPIQLFATAWLPWVWLAGLELAKGAGERRGEGWGRVKGALALGVALGMEMLASQPQIVFYSLIAVGLSVLFYARRGKERGDAESEEGEVRPLPGRDEGGTGDPGFARVGIDAQPLQPGLLKSPTPAGWNWRVGPALAAAGLLAGALAAVLWLPAWDLSHYSVTRRGDYTFATSYSLPWRNLWTLLLPGWLGTPATGGYHGDWNFAETTIFMGQAALGLALAGLWAGRRRKVTWLLAATIAVSLVLALGGNTPVYRLLTRLLPPLLGFRAPARAFCLVTLAASVLAGRGLDAVLLRARARIQSAIKDAGETPALRARRYLPVLACGGVIALQLAGLAWFRWGLLGLNFQSARVLERPGLERVLAAAGAQPERSGRIFRLINESDYNDLAPAAVRGRVNLLAPDLNLLHGYRCVEGYDEGMLPTGFYLQLLGNFWRNLYTPRPDSLLLGLMGVEWLVSDKPILGDAGWVKAGVFGAVTLWHNRNYRGEIFTRGDWREVNWERVRVPDHIDKRNEQPVYVWQKPSDPRGEAGAGAGQERAAPKTGPIHYARSAPGRVDVTLPPGFAGELLLSESWLPGWRAEMDGGGAIAGRPLNPALIAFEIPQGTRRVTLRYAPRIFQIGLAISQLGLAAALGVWLWLRLRRRGRRMGASETRLRLGA